MSVSERMELSPFGVRATWGRVSIIAIIDIIIVDFFFFCFFLFFYIFDNSEETNIGPT